MLYQQQGQQQKDDAHTSARGNNANNGGVLDVGEINPELEANLVSIAAAAARPSAAHGHPHADNLAASIDPQIELQHHTPHQPQPDDDHQLRRALEHHHHHQHHQPQPQHTATQPHDTATSTTTSTTTTTANNGSSSGSQQQTVGPDGQPIDPKRTCPFCGRTFSHPGSLGRHLDLKRGTRLHPANKVDQIRGDVKRRGDIVEIKARRSKRAKIYNSRPDVKDRARARRKHKERSDKARGIAKSRFIDRLGVPQLPPHPSFAFMVLYFLPPSQWPHDPPTRQTYDQLQTTLDSLPHELRSKAEVAFEQWSVMNMQTKMDIWAREQRRAAEAAIGSITLYDLGARESWLAMEESRIVSEMVANEDQNHQEEEDDSSSKHHESTSPHDPEVDAVAAAVAAATNQQPHHNHNHHHHHRDDVDINANIDEQLFN
ncbi:hypothetical protein TRICI_001129 [Trichomonascus ciferrii]|uniref:C2H2-type domain-containing protein n=1 Tax=Trichomonascus ciferrii TaxID=44093 RepID=A0A642VAB5_9ASCO|nr:hypothetical protein TRICI_001129 [Trichomonascus ciferrii]